MKKIRPNDTAPYFKRLESSQHRYEYLKSHTANSNYLHENNQEDALYRLIYYSKSAVHVSDDVFDDVFAHHQEDLTVFTVSGSVRPSNLGEYSQVLLMMGENIA
jgi:hypothetical protein